MTEELRQVIARIKAGKQNSQQSQSNKVVESHAPIKKEIPVPQETEEEILDDDEADDMGVPFKEEMPEKEEISHVMPQKQGREASKQQDAIAKSQQEIMFLQDNGIFRVQILNQLQEINKALVVIAGVLVDLTGNGKGNQ